MARHYLKDKKITIYKNVTIKDSSGFHTRGYMPITEAGPQWAYFKQLSASLLYVNQSTNTKEDCFFRVNWSDYLRTAYASDLSIGYQGRVYKVTRIDPYEDYTRDIALYANSVNTVRLSPIVPFDPELL